MEIQDARVGQKVYFFKWKSVTNYVKLEGVIEKVGKQRVWVRLTTGERKLADCESLDLIKQ